MNVAFYAVPWGLWGKLAALMQSLHRLQAQGLPSWQTRPSHATAPVFQTPEYESEIPLQIRGASVAFVPNSRSAPLVLSNASLG